jgi:hypothetical protein
LIIGTIPPSGVKESCIEFTAPQLASVVTDANRADLLAFHVAARLRERRLLINVMHQRIRLGFRPIAGEYTDEPQDGHAREYGPTVLSGANHLAQRHREARRYEEDRQQLQKIRQRSWIFERMGAVGIEETTTVRPEHLDRFLRSDRALGDGLCGNSRRQTFAVRPSRRDRLRLQHLDHVVRL